MATAGLKGIWGLEQLDKTGIATWKMAALLMGTTPLIGAMLYLVLGDVDPDSVLASTFTPELMFWLLVSLQKLQTLIHQKCLISQHQLFSESLLSLHS